MALGASQSNGKYTNQCKKHTQIYIHRSHTVYKDSEREKNKGQKAKNNQ